MAGCYSSDQVYNGPLARLCQPPRLSAFDTGSGRLPARSANWPSGDSYQAKGDRQMQADQSDEIPNPAPIEPSAATVPAPTAKSDEPKARGDRWEWVSPAFSLVALLISLITAYQSNWDRGTLKVFVPRSISLRQFSDGSIALLVPMLINDTGAARNQRVITGVTANVGSVDGSMVALVWTEDRQYVGWLEYITRFPSRAAFHREETRDYEIYAARAFPFILYGGMADFRHMYLQQVTQAVNGLDLSVIDLGLEVATNNAVYAVRASYRRAPDPQTAWIRYEQISPSP